MGRLSWRTQALGVLFVGVFVASGCVDAVPESPTTKDGAKGLWSFHLEAADEVREGANDFTIEVRDLATDAPILGVDLSITVLMPSMGHETEPGNVAESGAGVYDLDDIELDMPGSWALRIRGMTELADDEVEFRLEVL